jgi:phage-related holin
LFGGWEKVVKIVLKMLVYQYKAHIIKIDNWKKWCSIELNKSKNLSTQKHNP